MTESIRQALILGREALKEAHPWNMTRRPLDQHQEKATQDLYEKRLAVIELALQQVQAPPPGEAQLLGLANRTAWRHRTSTDPHHSDTWTFNVHTLMGFARSVGAMYEDRKA